MIASWLLMNISFFSWKHTWCYRQSSCGRPCVASDHGDFWEIYVVLQIIEMWEAMCSFKLLVVCKEHSPCCRHCRPLECEKARFFQTNEGFGKHTWFCRRLECGRYRQGLYTENCLAYYVCIDFFWLTNIYIYIYTYIYVYMSVLFKPYEIFEYIYIYLRSHYTHTNGLKARMRRNFPKYL